MRHETIKILLADLTYKQISPSPLPVPFAIGKLAMYVKGKLSQEVEIKIVRTPEQFYSSLDSKFDIAGFSHYIWNTNLSKLLAQHLKISQPNCVIVFGGPHLPINIDNQVRYLQSFNPLDFFIEKEGEVAFYNLIVALAENRFDVEYVKDLRIKSVRSIKNNMLISSPLEERILDLDSVSSPYLEGLMDEFLEQGFTPLIENHRGCPFSCDFCGEGDRYHSRVALHSIDYLKKEYEYVAKKMASLKHLPFFDTVYFSDSNTGMYAMDIDLCTFLRELQEKYNWPRKIVTSTGKNLNGKIINCIELLGGALTLTASVQSTDPEVLSNVKRKNISNEALMLAARGRGTDHKSFSEIILGLPGDSYEKHLKSIKDMMDAHINDLRILQLMILPDTPMDSLQYKDRFKLRTKFRVLSKGFDRVKVGDSYKIAVEYEEICVETENLSFEDYIKCRILCLMVNIFSQNTFSIFSDRKLSPFEYLKLIFDMGKPVALVTLINQFTEALQEELFDTREDIERVLSKDDTYEKLRKSEIGRNPLYYFSEEIIKHPKEVYLIASKAAEIIGGADLAKEIVKDICCFYRWPLYQYS